MSLFEKGVDLVVKLGFVPEHYYGQGALENLAVRVKEEIVAIDKSLAVQSMEVSEQNAWTGLFTNCAREAVKIGGEVETQVADDFFSLAIGSNDRALVDVAESERLLGRRRALSDFLGHVEGNFVDLGKEADKHWKGKKLAEDVREWGNDFYQVGKASALGTGTVTALAAPLIERAPILIPMALSILSSLSVVAVGGLVVREWGANKARKEGEYFDSYDNLTRGILKVGNELIRE